MKYIVVMWCIPSEETWKNGRPLCPPSSPPRIMSIFWFSLPLVLLPLVSGSLLHRHAVLGGLKGHRCTLTRMEGSEAARPLMEPARNVISCARRFTQYDSRLKVRSWLAWACSRRTAEEPLGHEPEEPGTQPACAAAH